VTGGSGIKKRSGASHRYSNINQHHQVPIFNRYHHQEQSQNYHLMNQVVAPDQLLLSEYINKTASIGTGGEPTNLAEWESINNNNFGGVGTGNGGGSFYKRQTLNDTFSKEQWYQASLQGGGGAAPSLI
jgi:hypothetical protein